MTNKVKGLLSTIALLLAVCMLALGFAACSGSNSDSAHADAMGSDVPTKEPVTDIPTEAPVTDVPTEEPATEEPTDAPITDGATPEKTPLPDDIEIVVVTKEGYIRDGELTHYKHYLIRSDLYHYLIDNDCSNKLFEVALLTGSINTDGETEEDMVQMEEELSEELSQAVEELNALGYNLKQVVYRSLDDEISGLLYGCLTAEQILNIPEPYAFMVGMLRFIVSDYRIPSDKIEFVSDPPKGFEIDY